MAGYPPVPRGLTGRLGWPTGGRSLQERRHRGQQQSHENDRANSRLVNPTPEPDFFREESFLRRRPPENGIFLSHEVPQER